MALITIDMDALARAIDSNTDADEREARAIINTVLATQPAAQRLSDEQIDEIVLTNATSDHPTAQGLARAIEAALATSRAPAATDTLPPSYAAADAYKVVPVEPTDEMLRAEWNVTMSDAHTDTGVAYCAWQAMLNAAPNCAALAAAPQPAERSVIEQALELLDDMFAAYENGVSCYEDPEDHSGYIGKAFKLTDDAEESIISLLNKHRPRAALAGEAATQPAAPQRLSDEQVKAHAAKAGLRWIDPIPNEDGSEGYPGGFDMCSLDEVRAVLASRAAPSDARDAERMLTTDEVWRVWEERRAPGPVSMAEAVQRKFCEVNGIALSPSLRDQADARLAEQATKERT